MTILVHRAGLLTTVHDLGRWGHQAWGVPVAGPMDAWSHRLANLAVGNPGDAAVLEVTLDGPELEVRSEVRLAVTGATFMLEIGGRPSQSPLVADVPAGTRVTFTRRLAGARAYVAVSGGIDVPLVLGSRATDLRGRFGGVSGRRLRSGDALACGWAPARRRRLRELPAAVLPSSGRPTVLRVVEGPRSGVSVTPALDWLLGSTYHLSNRSDRMGYRLEGAPSPSAPGGAMVSMPTVMGAIQLPPSGLPVVLMADRQTTGGYAPVAVVVSADLPLAGQLGPGDEVRFEACSPGEAMRALVAREQALLALEGA